MQKMENKRAETYLHPVTKRFQVAGQSQSLSNAASISKIPATVFAYTFMDAPQDPYFYILPCNTWRRCLCYSGRTLQQGREFLLVLLAHTSNSYSCSTSSLAIHVPYLEVVIQDPGILYCSVLFVTKHCHVQEGLAAHAVNRKKPKSQHLCPLLLARQQSTMWDGAGTHQPLCKFKRPQDFSCPAHLRNEDSVKKKSHNRKKEKRGRATF